MEAWQLSQTKVIFWRGVIVNLEEERSVLLRLCLPLTSGEFFEDVSLEKALGFFQNLNLRGLVAKAVAFLGEQL